MMTAAHHDGGTESSGERPNVPELIESPIFIQQLCSPEARTVHKGIAGLCEALAGRRSARMQHVENVEWFGWVGSALRRFSGVSEASTTSMALARAAAILLALDGPLLARAMPEEIVIFLDTALFLLEKPIDDEAVTVERRRELEWCLACAGFVPGALFRPAFPWRPVSAALQLVDSTRSDATPLSVCGSPPEPYVHARSVALRGLWQRAPPPSDTLWRLPHWPPLMRRLVLPPAPAWAAAWLGQSAADRIALVQVGQLPAWHDAVPLDASHPPKSIAVRDGAAGAKHRWTAVAVVAAIAAAAVFAGMWYTAVPPGADNALTAGLASFFSVTVAVVGMRIAASMCWFWSLRTRSSASDTHTHAGHYWTGEDVAYRLLHQSVLCPDSLPQPPKYLRASFPIEWSDAPRVDEEKEEEGDQEVAEDIPQPGAEWAESHRDPGEHAAAAAAGAGLGEHGTNAAGQGETTDDDAEGWLEAFRAQVRAESQNEDGEPASLPIPTDLLDTLQELSRDLHEAGSDKAREVDEAIQFVQRVAQQPDRANG